jgi:hypothetical protein
MEPTDEVIALFLDEEEESRPLVAIDPASATCLVRGADGNVRLLRPDSREELERTAERTGIFKRGTPIIDPASGEIIGYEMEKVTSGAAAH